MGDRQEGRRPCVVVTGGSGRVATLLRAGLGGTFDLRLVDCRPGEDVLVGDLADPGFAAAAVSEADAIVHLAGHASPDASWDILRTVNVDLSVTMFEAARRAGVAAFVYASSIHASGGYDLDGIVPVRASWPPRPCCLYGASKAAVEAIGSHYADAYDIAVTCLRLGWTRPRPHLPRALVEWLSPGDLGRLVVAALRSDQRFGVYYGVSANTRGRWDLDTARREIGYAPADDAEDYVHEIDFAAEDSSICRRGL
ncbi:NAD-dependent epimerase/dehydratase family protein [Nonomuraea sp. 10N515B]|uniref:NAD-dependent epimerase/dehydratase family protein n=1 Tax=Nonomuraea sp. 10N515B TaxID=3457422 RepID=UPI003FCD8EA7